MEPKLIKITFSCKGYRDLFYFDRDPKKTKAYLENIKETGLLMVKKESDVLERLFLSNLTIKYSYIEDSVPNTNGYGHI